MNLFQLIALLVTLTAVFGYLNHRYARLPTTIGVMLFALVLSLALILLDRLGVPVQPQAEAMLERLDFDQTLLHGMLSFLLFAGALHVDINRLARQKWIIALLATLGVALSTVLVATFAWWTFRLSGLAVSYTHCLLFGALISPTDPIAVSGILKKARVPESLETKITGESLFNDGVGVVLFLVLLAASEGGHAPGVADVAILFVEEALGGAAFGLLVGYAAYLMLKGLDSYQVEILITLALVTGTYALADALHLSAPIAVVVAGLLIGNRGRLLAMSDRTREHLDTFWELVDELLNAVLFVLLGFEVLAIWLEPRYLAVGLAAVPLVLLARLLSVSLPMLVLRQVRTFSPHAAKLLTWGGLRGGISVALALSLPPGPERQLLLTVTYTVVLFSILIQGLTIERVVRWATRGPIAEAG